jgi:hypothetical protein
MLQDLLAAPTTAPATALVATRFAGQAPVDPPVQSAPAPIAGEKTQPVDDAQEVWGIALTGSLMVGGVLLVVALFVLLARRSWSGPGQRAKGR